MGHAGFSEDGPAQGATAPLATASIATAIATIAAAPSGRHRPIYHHPRHRHRQVQLVLDLAKLGVDALTVDADAFILREPWQYIKRFPRADVLMSSDMLHATLGYNHTGLEDQGGFGPDFNIGYTSMAEVPALAVPQLDAYGSTGRPASASRAQTSRLRSRRFHWR